MWALSRCWFPPPQLWFGSYALYRRASESTTLRVHLDGLLN
jgi:hypothetical protein